MLKKLNKNESPKHLYKLLAISLLLFALYYLTWDLFLKMFAGIFHGISSGYNGIALTIALPFVPLLLISILPTYALMKLLEPKLSKYNLDRALSIPIYAAICITSMIGLYILRISF